jgi:peptidylprolyl isomerase
VSINNACWRVPPCRRRKQPLEFVAGEPVNVSARKINDSAGGLFAGGSGPKPPPAISTAVIGMKPGGRVSLD